MVTDGFTLSKRAAIRHFDIVIAQINATAFSIE